MSEPYSRTGARRDEANLWQRYGGRTFPGGESLLMGVESALGKGQPLAEVCTRGERGCEPVS